MRKRRTDDLIGEKLREILHGLVSAKKNKTRPETDLAVEVGFSGLGRIQLESLPDTFTKYMTRGVCFHNLRHGLLDERLETGEPVPKGRPQVISQVHANHETGWRRVNAHGVRDLEEPATSAHKFRVEDIEPT